MLPFLLRFFMQPFALHSQTLYLKVDEVKISYLVYKPYISQIFYEISYLPSPTRIINVSRSEKSPTQLLQEFPRTGRTYGRRFSRKNHYRQGTESEEFLIYISHLAVGIPQSPAHLDLAAFCNKLPPYSW